MRQNPTARIVYIAGTQNSGSTLLDTILGNAPGVFSLGEVAGFHRYATEASCDCGRAPASCSPCLAVVSSLADHGELAALQRIGTLPLKERRIHWLLVGSRRRREYARLADRIFAAVAAATASTVLIDSSKNVARAAALSRDSRHDVRVVHLVRDGRGYLASRKRRSQVTGNRHIFAAAFASWLAKNLLLSEVLKRRLPAERYMLCRYEDLVSNPEGELERIGRFAGIDTAGLCHALMGRGLDRSHLFEPRRRADYRTVRLDPNRLAGQRAERLWNSAYWAFGGFVSRRWGYDRQQSYLCRPSSATVE